IRTVALLGEPKVLLLPAPVDEILQQGRRGLPRQTVEAGPEPGLEAALHAQQGDQGAMQGSQQHASASLRPGAGQQVAQGAQARQKEIGTAAQVDERGQSAEPLTGTVAARPAELALAAARQ